MGLFGKGAYELRQLLDAMHMSSTGDIDMIIAGTPPPVRQYSETTNLNHRIGEAADIVVRMVRKGKADEARRILDEFEAKPVPQLVRFRADLPSRESFAEAQADASARLAEMAPDPEQEEKDLRWKRVISEIRERASA